MIRDREFIPLTSQKLGLVLSNMVVFGVETVSCEQSTFKIYLESKQLARHAEQKRVL
jgi:hypothetical protein